MDAVCRQGETRQTARLLRDTPASVPHQDPFRSRTWNPGESIVGLFRRSVLFSQRGPLVGPVCQWSCSSPDLQHSKAVGRTTAVARDRFPNRAFTALDATGSRSPKGIDETIAHVCRRTSSVNPQRRSRKQLRQCARIDLKDRSPMTGAECSGKLLHEKDAKWLPERDVGLHRPTRPKKHQFAPRSQCPAAGRCSDELASPVREIHLSGRATHLTGGANSRFPSRASVCGLWRPQSKWQRLSDCYHHNFRQTSVNCTLRVSDGNLVFFVGFWNTEFFCDILAPADGDRTAMNSTSEQKRTWRCAAAPIERQGWSTSIHPAASLSSIRHAQPYQNLRFRWNKQ